MFCRDGSHVPQVAMHAGAPVMLVWPDDTCRLHLTSSLMTNAEGRPGVAEADKQQIRSNLVPVIIRYFPPHYC